MRMTKRTKSDLTASLGAARAATLSAFWQPILQRQLESTRDREARGPCWVSRLVLPQPAEADALELLLAVIGYLGDGKERYERPSLADVPVHWVGARKGVRDRKEAAAAEPKMGEGEKFKALDAEAVDGVTVMYMYGGVQFFNGPTTRRATATNLATLTQGRCMIVQHRLAPQNSFPCAPLDVFVAYLSLLYPSPSSPHSAVLPSQIVLAGDSSGGQLAMSLLQLLLATHQPDFVPTAFSNRSIRFNGHDIPLPLPLPAGVTLQSPGLDHQGHCLPSWAANTEKDIFPLDPAPSLDPRFPADAAWPTVPPRGNLYADTSCLAHPLVSPITARSWAGAPPIYFFVGSHEVCLDASRFVAQHASSAGVVVRWDEYEGMMHNWPMLLKGWPQAEMCYRRWAEACLALWKGKKVETQGWFTEFESLDCRKLDTRSLTRLTLDGVKALVGEKVRALEELMERRAAQKCLL